MKKSAVALIFLLALGCQRQKVTGAGCLEDKDCGDPASAYRCETQTGICYCRTNEACPPRQFCNPAGFCQDRAGCEKNSDCLGDSLFCDTTTGTCLNKGRCSGDPTVDSCAEAPRSPAYRESRPPADSVIERTLTGVSPSTAPTPATPPEYRELRLLAMLRIAAAVSMLVGAIAWGGEPELLEGELDKHTADIFDRRRRYEFEFLNPGVCDALEKSNYQVSTPRRNH